MRTRGQVVSALAAVALGCAGGLEPQGDGGAPLGDGGSFQGLIDAGAPVDAGVDGGGTVAAEFPAWLLEDVQPQSPRAGQTYGLQAFLGRPLVVMLLQGY